MKIEVAKFGGSSVRDFRAMEQCARIVQANPNLRVAVISATYNTTNQLEDVAQKALEGKILEAETTFDQIRKRHVQMANLMGSNDEFHGHLTDLFSEGPLLIEALSQLKNRKDPFPKLMDHLYSIGERVSSLLFAKTLENVLEDDRSVYWQDARNIIKTDSAFGRAKPHLEKIKEQVHSYFDPILNTPNSLIVTQGFIGSNEDGETTTLGREGSDFTGALIAGALKAQKLEIWTDVPGVFTTDPRILSEAKPIKEIDFELAHIMAQNGAKVLFPETLMPVKDESIPVFVGQTEAPEKGGTWIRSIKEPNAGPCALTTEKCSDKEGLVRLSIIGHNLKELYKNSPVPWEKQLDEEGISYFRNSCENSIVCYEIPEKNLEDSLRFIHQHL